MVTISVVMPTYNTDVPILREAVDSILAQTFRDFEFLIIDDCSTNESVEYLNTLTDPRIRIIRNETNMGITKSLNIGFREAKGKYIARMAIKMYLRLFKRRPQNESGRRSRTAKQTDRSV